MKTLRSALSRVDWQQLNRLLERGMALEGPARASWLEATARDHAQLQPLLLELLAEADTGADAGEYTVSAVERMASDALAAAMRHECVGDRVGPWRLVAPLGTGGMGDVWKAERADGVMERTAALKLPRAEWVDRGVAGRIARERAILARLQHPNIAVLYDAGVTPEGRPYLALEYVEGMPIDLYASSQGLDLRGIARLVIAVVRAVEYAHSRLVIHRDIKPGNVLVAVDGRPKLLDFGISKLLEAEMSAADQTALTRLGGRPLTLAYAAPEQVLGEPATVATDVYALGVLLFKLLTGVRPYPAEQAHALAQDIVRGDVRRPSDVATDRARRAALRGDLDAIILTALARDPKARYASASALGDDLERYLAGQPLRAHPDSSMYRLGKFLRRNWMPVAAAVAATLAMAIGTSLALWQAHVARQQSDEVAAMNTFVLSLIRQADPNATRQTRSADVAMLATIEQRIDSEFKGSPQQMLRLRLTVGDAYRNRGEGAAAQRVYRRAGEEAAPWLATDDLQLLTAQIRAADPQLIVSLSAAERLSPAIAILRTKGQAGAELLIEALMMRSALGNSYGVPDYPAVDRRLDDLEEALAVAGREFGAGSRQHLRVMLDYARLRSRTESRGEIQHLVAGALATARARTDDASSSPEYGKLEIDRLVNLCRGSTTDASISSLWAVADAARAAHGETSVQYEHALGRLADCYEDLYGDPTGRALRGVTLAVATARERSPSMQVLRRAQDGLFQSILLRDFAGAERYYARAMENAAAILDPALRDRIMRPVPVARVCLLADRGEADAAERFAMPLVAAVSAEFARVGRLAPAEGWLWNCLSFAHRQQGRFADAIDTAQTFLERCRASQIAPRLCAAQGMTALAFAQLDAGMNVEAMTTLEERRKAMIGGAVGLSPDAALARGRVQLALGFGTEAIEHLRDAYRYWLSSSDPRNVYAIEAEYWLGRAYLAVGDARGGWMVAGARRALAASPLQHHRRLAAEAVPSARVATAASPRS